MPVRKMGRAKGVASRSVQPWALGGKMPSWRLAKSRSLGLREMKSQVSLEEDEEYSIVFFFFLRPPTSRRLEIHAKPPWNSASNSFSWEDRVKIQAQPLPLQELPSTCTS